MEIEVQVTKTIDVEVDGPRDSRSSCQGSILFVFDRLRRQDRTRGSAGLSL